MKKFGFGKKDKSSDGSVPVDDDSKRGALFGRSKKDSSSGSGGGNPYANNPYAQQDAPPAYSGGSDQFRQEKSPVPQGGYSSFGSGNGGNDRFGGSGNYGSQGSYGQSRYGSGSPAPSQSSAPSRQGGYGGFGDDNNDASRQQLFGAAPQRAQQQAPPERPAYGGSGGSYQSGNSGNSYGGAGAGGASGGYGDSTSGGYGSGGYGAYGDRELTAEEQEEEDVNAAKQEIKFIKQQDVSSTRNALRLAQQAEETGRGTLARLGEQGERIHNTERNLDLASTQNRIAQEKARELKTLNKSMFAVHVANPFTSKQRAMARDQKILDEHQRDRDQRDNTRKAAWESNARQQEFARESQTAGGPTGNKRGNLAERARYQFEADSDDDKLEDEIDSNLDALHGAAGRLKNLSLAMGKEVESQNKHIDRITKKTDDVDDQIAMNRARLDRIH